MEKYCYKCKQKKSLEDFNRNKANKDGLADECRVCHANQDRVARQKRRQTHKANPPHPSGTQRCSMCHEDKPYTEYTRDNSRTSGFQHRCKPCQKIYHKRWRETSEVFKEYQSRYYKENKAYINERNRAYYERNKEWLLPLMNQRRFERKYGITKEQALDMLALQNGCAICHTNQPGSKGWCVDHNHENGEVRGILCSKCNSGIAFLGDTLTGIEQAAKYLSTTRS